MTNTATPIIDKIIEVLIRRGKSVDVKRDIYTTVNKETYKYNNSGYKLKKEFYNYLTQIKK